MNFFYKILSLLGIYSPEYFLNRRNLQKGNYYTFKEIDDELSIKIKQVFNELEEKKHLRRKHNFLKFSSIEELIHQACKIVESDIEENKEDRANGYEFNYILCNIEELFRSELLIACTMTYPNKGEMVYILARAFLYKKRYYLLDNR